MFFGLLEGNFLISFFCSLIAIRHALSTESTNMSVFGMSLILSILRGIKSIRGWIILRLGCSATWRLILVRRPLQVMISDRYCILNILCTILLDILPGEGNSR